MKNTEMAESAAHGAATRKTPKPVATPFPPRKWSQMGNMWPRTAHRAARAWAERKGVPGIRSAPRNPPSQTAEQPLSTSSRKVAAPRPLPPERRTLVAPILPLPTERMSSLRKMRTSKYPVGMDPSRYAATAMRMMARSMTIESLAGGAGEQGLGPGAESQEVTPLQGSARAAAGFAPAW